MSTTYPRSLRLDSKIVKKIESCNTQKCWELVKDYVAAEVLDENMIPIPFLSETDRYDLNSVIMVKKNNVFRKLFRMKNKALPVDFLQEMIRSDVSIAESYELTHPVKINSAFNHLTAIYGAHDRKAFAVHIAGLSQYHLHHLPRDIMVDLTPYFEDFHFTEIYIITKVIYADDFRIRVIIRSDFKDFRPRCRIPIGFQLTKFRILYGALIGRHRQVEEKLNWKWVKFSQTIIPSTLLVDRDNRGGGDDGKRRHGPRNVEHTSIFRLLDETSSDEGEDDVVVNEDQ